MHWDEIWDIIRQLNFEDDGSTHAIVKQLKLNVNHITLELLYVSLELPLMFVYTLITV